MATTKRKTTARKKARPAGSLDSCGRLKAGFKYKKGGAIVKVAKTKKRKR